MLKILAISTVLCLGGCAHIAEIVDNPSIETKQIRDGDHRIISMTGDRRMIRSKAEMHSVPSSDRTDRTAVAGTMVVCAETQADAISARGSSSGLSVAARGSLTDQITESLTQTYARTELSDVVRQLSWQLCNANMNGNLPTPIYQIALLELQNEALQVLRVRTATTAEELKKMQEANANRQTEFAKALADLRSTWFASEAERYKQLTLEACKSKAKNDDEALKKCAPS